MTIPKKHCVEAWIDEIRPFGDCLEIGSGPSCSCIQLFHPKSHVIICKTATSSKHVHVIEDVWQNALPGLGMFDFIFYNGKQLEKSHAEKGSSFLQEGKETMRKTQEMVPGLASTRYIDRDLDSFCEKIGQKQEPALSRFLSELRENGQITEEQHERAVKKYQLKMIDPKKNVHGPDPLFECLLECLKHMQKGGRFSCLIGPSSKYEDPKFFEHIIANPSLDYQEKTCGESTYMVIERLA